MAEIHELSAVQLRDALRSGELSARQAAAHYLDRIDAGNPHLGAFITVTAEQALQDAAAADSAHARAARTGTGLPLLHGMPVAFKDLTDVAGVVTTHGSAALEHRPALADGALAAALKGAGAVSLGKTQVPEFGLTAYSENRIAPPSRNPLRAQPQFGRLLGRQCCRCGGGAGALRARERRRRLGPHSGCGLRPGGAETRPRTGARGRKRGRSCRAGGRRSAGPLRRGCGPAA